MVADGMGSVEYRRLECGAGDGSCFIELTLKSALPTVPIVRRFIASLYERTLGSGSIASRLLLVSHELLENAIKCSIDEVTRLRVEIKRHDGYVDMIVSTTNRSRPEDIATLRRVLDGMAASSDAASHYQALMRTTVTQPTGSGLGLARIRAEADMDISGHIESDVVTVAARATAEAYAA